MDSQKFGSFISSIRKEKGLTQAQLAQKISVTDKAVSRWETGKGFPDISTLKPLSEALGVSVIELLQSERVVEEHISITDAGNAFDGMVDIVTYQRDVERRNLIIAILAPIVVVMCVFLIDTANPFAFFFVYLPCACLLLGIVLIAFGVYRKRRRHPYAGPLVLGIIALLYIVVMICFLAAAMLLGGPTPS